MRFFIVYIKTQRLSVKKQTLNLLL